MEGALPPQAAPSISAINGAFNPRLVSGCAARRARNRLPDQPDRATQPPRPCASAHSSGKMSANGSYALAFQPRERGVLLADGIPDSRDLMAWKLSERGSDVLGDGEQGIWGRP